ncbi:WecB/TagA/CpsF family glycosyltransferase [Sphaerotilus microaerophilus]|uniref:UDP-N-acetyl-D-mannosaminuronic acid transferase n=1 Tax=Sphaerotilus microaerophilus TaxID=2914710 RepID=A0ABM7YKK0_9BURK|nr:WecB/TagA/CpsF family glycosyltransferase [Sphaerotilus sp. FB-5]BDI04938.1 UDP-N-acetyl-D-mannosaminuronic acid transferase [Sphaerotilus sp. FB-5]
MIRTNRTILGVDIAVRQSAALVQELLDRTSTGETVRVAFANANLLNVSATSPPLRVALRRFLVVNDGSGINLASRLLGYGAFPDNLNGTDFIPYFLTSAHRTLKIYLLGASAEVVSQAAAVIRQRWPEHRVVGLRDGYFHSEQEPEIRREIAETGADVVLVALGNGKQEHFAATLDQTGAAVFCVGALFDFLSGRVGRAPTWMRGLGIEWVYRLLLEPGRLWRRYVLGNPLFVWRVLWSRGRSGTGHLQEGQR